MRQLRRLTVPTAADVGPCKRKFREDSHDELEIREHKEKELGLTRLEWQRSTFLRRRLETQLAEAEEACKNNEVELDRLEREAWEATCFQQQLEQRLADSQAACKEKELELDRLERDAEEATSLQQQLEQRLADTQKACEKKEIQVAVLRAEFSKLQTQLDPLGELQTQLKLKDAQMRDEGSIPGEVEKLSAPCLAEECTLHRMPPNRIYTPHAIAAENAPTKTARMLPGSGAFFWFACCSARAFQ